jgi:hypothetical protein
LQRIHLAADLIHLAADALVCRDHHPGADLIAGRDTLNIFIR